MLDLNPSEDKAFIGYAENGFKYKIKFKSNHLICKRSSLYIYFLAPLCFLCGPVFLIFLCFHLDALAQGSSQDKLIMLTVICASFYGICTMIFTRRRLDFDCTEKKIYLYENNKIVLTLIESQIDTFEVRVLGRLESVRGMPVPYSAFVLALNKKDKSEILLAETTNRKLAELFLDQIKTYFVQKRRR